MTIGRIAECLREVGDYGAGRGVEIWMEVHGRGTQNPPISAAIMRATKHERLGVLELEPNGRSERKCQSELRSAPPLDKNVHINELADDRYPWRELFSLLRRSRYETIYIVRGRGKQRA